MPSEHPETPWRFPIRSETRGEIEYKFFEKDRKGGRFKGGGAVEVQVFLGGAWHEMRFATDGEGYRRLARLPEQARAVLLSSLALLPLLGGCLPRTGRKRARGISKRNAAFWHNVDRWAPEFLAWTVDALAQKKKPGLLRRVCASAHTAGLHTRTPEEIAAALCLLAWAAVHAANPDRFPMPHGKNLQAAVATRLTADASPNQHGVRPTRKKWIEAVLRPGPRAERLCRAFPVTSPSDKSWLYELMTDFRRF